MQPKLKCQSSAEYTADSAKKDSKAFIAHGYGDEPNGILIAQTSLSDMHAIETVLLCHMVEMPLRAVEAAVTLDINQLKLGEIGSLVFQPAQRYRL